MADEIELTEWHNVVDALTAFSEEAVVTDDEVAIQFEQAHVTIRRDGYIDTGMPLHGFSRDSGSGAAGVTLSVDEEEGVLHVNTESVSYTFRRP